MAEKCTMNLDKLENIININLDTKVSPRSSFTFRELFSALVDSSNIEQAAEKLNVTTNSLEHSLSRNVKKLFPTKATRCSWNNFLIGLLGFKKCQKCTQVLELTNYSKSSSTFDGYNYTCKSCRSVYRQSFTENNPEYNKKDYINNKSEYIARAIKYNTRRNTATPLWADLEIIKRVYDCAEGDHVDHIIPLQGELVCGLHVENNLQYLSEKENLQKSNKFDIE
jgi:hypothetical protein